MLMKIPHIVIEALESALVMADGNTLFCLRYKHLNRTAGSKEQHALDVKVALAFFFSNLPQQTHCRTASVPEES